MVTSPKMMKEHTFAIQRKDTMKTSSMKSGAHSGERKRQSMKKGLAKPTTAIHHLSTLAIQEDPPQIQTVGFNVGSAPAKDKSNLYQPRFNATETLKTKLDDKSGTGPSAALLPQIRSPDDDALSTVSLDSMNQLQTEDEIEKQHSQWLHCENILEEFSYTCGSDVDFEDFFIAMFTRTVLIPGQVADFENWLSANRVKRGYGNREFEEMLYIKELSISRMAEEVSPKNVEKQGGIEELDEAEVHNPLDQAMEDSNEVHEQSPE